MRWKYRYPLSFALGLGVLPLAFVVSMPFIIRDAYAHHMPVTGAFILVFALLVALFVPSLTLSVVTVSMGEQGIATYWLGFRTQKYRWVDVKRIVKTKSLKNPSPPNEFVEIMAADQSWRNFVPNAFGAIKVNELLCDYADFRAKLNDYAHNHGIPIRFVDELTARSAATPAARRLAMRDGVEADSI